MPLLPLSLLSSFMFFAPAPAPLTHEFKAGEKFAYQVLSHIGAEQRGAGLDTWIPNDLDINYNFTYTVTKLGNDGIAVIHYLRPRMSEVTGETFDSGPQTKVENVNFNSIVTVSPINEILEQKDAGKSASAAVTRPLTSSTRQGAMGFFAPFISDIHRLALFIGNVQDGLDFAPKLPLQPIKVGDSWQKTVGFEPQALKGKSGKQAVQRLDYTYTYLGPMQNHEKTILRVEGKLSFSTDAATYFKQLLADHASETNVSKVPLHFNSTIDFDLDPTTRDLLEGNATTEGGFQVFITESGDAAVTEEKFKGRTSIELVGKKMVGKSS